MFKKAIVRKPCRNLVNGLTTANLGKPDYQLALIQHQAYIESLEECGLEVIVLEADEKHPDSTFIEDTALLTAHCAIIANPGAHSRNGEIIELSQLIENVYPIVDSISTPGTLEGGDILMVGNHFYIGISERTNLFGANQLIGILAKYGLIGSTIPVENFLHLKSGVSYLENNNLLVTRRFKKISGFQKYNLILVDDDESYAANSLWINDKVLVPKGFPKTRKKTEKAGYSTIEIDVSEFRKLDGGLSCLSLRY